MNFRRLLRDGDLRQNIALRTGDTIVVPDNLTEQAFVFGGAAGSNSRGGPVPFVDGRLDLLQALAAAGIGFRERVQGKLSEVRIIRSEADRGLFFVVDVNRILRGDASSFLLAPGNMVARLGDRRDQLERSHPGDPADVADHLGIAEPVGQIKYLSQ